MKNFKKWVYKNASKIDPYYKDCKPNEELSADVLVNAMWRINRKYNENCNKGFCIKQNDALTAYISIYETNDTVELSPYFWFSDNSEQQALTAALNYIFNNNKGGNND